MTLALDRPLEPSSPEDLARLLGATPLPPLEVTMTSGEVHSVSRLLRVESRVPDRIERVASCWAPNKPSIMFAGRPTWAELVLVDLLQDAGWEARWIKNWVGGREFCTAVGHAAPLSPLAAELFGRIDRRAASKTGGGAWDVFAWNGTACVILESKQHHSSDKLRPGQVAWLEAGLTEGVPISAFGVVDYQAVTALDSE